MLRDERDWRNVHLVEQERGDFADEMARLLWFSAYQVELHTALSGSSDEIVAGVAGKALKEVRYHLDHASLWVVRLGDGTEESHRRMQDALDRVLPYLAELFDDDEASAQRQRLTERRDSGCYEIEVDAAQPLHPRRGGHCHCQPERASRKSVGRLGPGGLASADSTGEEMRSVLGVSRPSGRMDGTLRCSRSHHRARPDLKGVPGASSPESASMQNQP